MVLFAVYRDRDIRDICKPTSYIPANIPHSTSQTFHPENLASQRYHNQRKTVTHEMHGSHFSYIFEKLSISKQSYFFDQKTRISIENSSF